MIFHSVLRWNFNTDLQQLNQNARSEQLCINDISFYFKFRPCFVSPSRQSTWSTAPMSSICLRQHQSSPRRSLARGPDCQPQERLVRAKLREKLRIEIRICRDNADIRPATNMPCLTCGNFVRTSLCPAQNSKLWQCGSAGRTHATTKLRRILRASKTRYCNSRSEPPKFIQEWRILGLILSI